MIWKNASEGDKQLFFAISHLYERHQNLLHLLFHPDRPQLINPEQNVNQRCSALSMGEKLLVRIGLDIWDGSSGGIHFNELYQTLDQTTFHNLLLALLYLRSPKKAILF